MKKIHLLVLAILILPTLSMAQFWEHHWIEENFVFTGSGGDALTVTKTDCEEGFVQVTDPVNAALPAFSPIIINPQNSEGADITDISSFPISFTMRARSAAELNVSLQLRSDDGTNDFRTDRVSATLPAGLDEWTEITIEITGDDIAGFNADNLRDVWFFLDRGDENFAGNELYIDYISLGGAPTPGLESPCALGETGMDSDTLIFADYFQTDDLQNISTGSSAGQVTTFTIDTTCESLQINVTDTMNAPLPAFNAYLVNPMDANGDDITDIAENVNVTMRVRSKEAIEIAILFRSGEGGSDERSDRKAVDIPAGLEEWTSFTIAFDSSEYAGFNPSDLRDMWFYLDRGEENFAGNELYIDHITIGGLPDTTFNSPCDLKTDPDPDPEPMDLIFADYFNGDSLQNINTSSSAGQVTTFTLDTLCETLQIAITDTTNNPLSAFNAYIINPFDVEGNEITDISGAVNVTMRVRSKEAIELSVLFRSGEGGSDERSDRKAVDIPGDLEQWTSFILTFDSTEYAGFNPADMRDMWFYLDRGVENFAGNEFYIDHIAIGGQPDTTLNSPCSLTPEPVVVTGPFEDYFQNGLDNINTGSTAAQVTTFTLDTICETLQISVTDPDNAPLPSFNAYFVNPTDTAGNEITDITGQVNVTMRVRSAEPVNVDILFRSGEGTQDERTDRKSVSIPGGLEEWTSFTLEFSDSDLSGFNPAALRDMWFYLDRGTPNFAGNEFYIDHVVIGTESDTTLNSPCSLEVSSQSWIENWDSDNAVVLGGAETEKLSVTQTDCEEVKIEVTDPNGDPHQAFRPIVINPTSSTGSEITNIADNVQVVIRARSAEEVPIGVLFRSGDGSTESRTNLLTQTVPATLEAWSTLTFTFTEEELGGFDPEDLRDFWVFLDRDNNNFPGNEIYFDYIVIGEQPDTTVNSPCGLPDFVVSTQELETLSFFEIFPNPVNDRLQIQFDQVIELEGEKLLNVYDAMGRVLLQRNLSAVRNNFTLDVSSLSKGIYYLQIRNDRYQFTKRIIKQ
ncbi:MAG: T9SS type A sorting domain-containing protein [Bacteroidota bacterium]